MVARLVPRLGFPSGGDLISATGLEKLNLSKEQKEKYDKINQEFQEKQKDAQAKVREAFKARDRAKVKEATETYQKVRTDYLGKVEAVLNDEQKKTFERVRREGQGRPNIDVRIGGGVPGQILPPAVQERLKLTDEQKKKVEELQKDVDSKIKNLLTDEQKKLFEDLKKGTLPRRPGGIELRLRKPPAIRE